MLFTFFLQPVSAEPTAAKGTNASDAPGPSDASAYKATSVILADVERGQVLFEKNSKMPLHISAACKLMTVLLAIESGELTSNVTISSDSVDAKGSALSLEAGKKYLLGDLLYGIMLTSANDAASAVAESIGGDIPKFVASMNEKAAKLGMKDTHFVNPTGLFDEEQYTTAYDISLLIKYAFTKPVFKTIFSEKARPWEYDAGSKILTSQNKLFWSYSGITGGKTGYNEKGKQSAVVTAGRNGMELIAVVLDSPEEVLFTDTAKLLDYGFDNFMKSILVNSGEVLKTVTVEENDINLVSQSDIYYIHPLGESYIKEFSTTTDIKPPISKSKPAGVARYLLQDNSLIEVNLYPQTEMITPPPEDFIATAKKQIMANKDIVYLVLFLLLLEFIFMVAGLVRLFRRLSRKRQERRRSR